MANMTKTTMDVVLPEVWSKLATITYRSNIVLASLMDRRWEKEVMPFGDVINIYSFAQSAVDASANSYARKRATFGTAAALTFDAVTETQTQLSVNQLAYYGYQMPDEMELQSLPQYRTQLGEGIGLAIAQQIDYELASDSTDGLDSFTAIGTDNQDITEDVIFQGEQNLNDNKALMSDRFFVVSPASRTSLLKIDSVRNSLYASSMGNLKASVGPEPSTTSPSLGGYLGKYLTLDVYMSGLLAAGTTGKKNAIWQRQAIALCVQNEVKVYTDFNIEDGFLHQVAGRAVYGFKKVKNAYGREVDGK